MTAPQGVATENLAHWPLRRDLELGGWLVTDCAKPGCYATLLRVHIATLRESEPFTVADELAAIEAHEPHCPTPPDPADEYAALRQVY